MHCKAVVANILPFQGGGEVKPAKTNLVRSNYSAAANPTPPKDALHSGKRSQISSFLAVATHSPGNGNGIRTFLGYGENGEAAPNITVIPLQIESTTRWNEMK